MAPWVYYGLSFFLGLLVGSFLNVCILRLPKGESVVWPGSHCPHCSRPIVWHDNVPLLSFLLLRARCRVCGGEISLQYPVVELLSAFLSRGCALKFRSPPTAALWFFSFVCPLIVISVIDFRHWLILDRITFPFLLVGIVVHGVAEGFHRWPATLIDSLLGILVGGGGVLLVGKLYQWIRKREGIGAGDVKLAAMIGAFLGWKAVVFVFVLSSFLGSILGIFLMIFSGRRLVSEIPYGPFLSLAALLHLFFGQQILKSYFHWVQGWIR